MSQRAPKDAPDASAGFGQWPFLGTNSAVEYWVDAWQRSVLLLDVLGQRGNNCIEHNARKMGRAGLQSWTGSMTSSGS